MSRMDQTDRPAVAVVIVNYNRRDWLADCLRSVLAQSVQADEVIVVDNGSTDGSAEMAQENFGDRVKLVRLDENRGFAGGNNAGAQASAAQWLALLNNDAAADPDWLSWMLAEARPGVGMIACRILRAEDRDLLDNLGVGLWPDGMSRGERRLERDDGSSGAAALLPSGCAMMIRREAFEAAGGFDEDFFCYSEDTDLGLKARLLGWRTAVADRATVYHRGGGGTLGVVSAQKIYLVERNRIAVLLRYFPWRSILSSPLWTAARYLGLGRELLRGRGQTGPGAGLIAGLAALFRAYAHGLARAGRDLRARREWRRRSPLGRELVALWLREHRLSWQSLVRLGPR